jgi:phosphonate transport system substrate-binding protein
MFKEVYKKVIYLRHRYMFIFFTLLFFLSACGDNGADVETQHVDLTHRVNKAEIENQRNINRSEETFYFGFDSRASVRQDAAQYLPFLDYLSTATGYVFKLHFTPKGSRLVDEFGNNTVQFAAIGALGFIEAKSLFNAVPLVRGLNQQDKAAYRSFFVVKPDSHISSVTEMKGQRLAFGSISSTQGHLIPRIILKEQGLTLSDFKTVNYTGSHANCAETVMAGGADICGMQDTLASSYEKQGRLKIIYRSNFYPSSGIAANNQVPEEVRQKVKTALLNFKPNGQHAELLYQWEKTEMPHGFILAQDEDYVELARWASFFGFINLEHE